MSVGIKSASSVRRALEVLLTFGAINAFAGGYYGRSGAKGIPVEWLDIRELREVLALAESGRLTPIPLEFWPLWPLDKIDEVYERVKHGQVAGRAVITP